MGVELAVRPGMGVGHRTDRIVYVFTAALFVVVAVVGFAPRSVAILGRKVPSPPVIVHVHAALMVGWLLLFLAQTSLIAAARRRWHQTLGFVSLVLAPAMVVTMIGATITGYGAATRAGFGELASNILLAQIKAVVLFALFCAWAVLTRRAAPDTHKRMMLMATLVLMDAATGRIEWLPGNVLSNSYAMAPFYHLALLAPALVSDVVRSGRLHRAYVIGLSLLLLFMAATRVLWSVPWWLRTAPMLMGVRD